MARDQVIDILKTLPQDEVLEALEDFRSDAVEANANDMGLGSFVCDWPGDIFKGAHAGSISEDAARVIDNFLADLVNLKRDEHPRMISEKINELLKEIGIDV